MLENNFSYKMIDISKKNISFRKACVTGSINIGKNVFNLIKNKEIEKGDPLILAEIAGINAVKNTSALILLCHQINIENTQIKIEIDEKNYKINVYCIVFSNSKTGVEMEAMCGVYAALLTIYDLTKKYNPFSIISDIKLLFKDGGESGSLGSINNIPYNLQKIFLDNKILFNKIKIIIITLSDRGIKGNYEDISGQFIFDFFKIRKAIIIKKIIMPDDEEILKKIIFNLTKKYNPNIIITNGGTGLNKRDITNKIISNICDKLIHGIPELLRLYNSNYIQESWLSLPVAGIYKKSLIISLPGNPTSIIESLNILEALISQSINIIKKT